MAQSAVSVALGWPQATEVRALTDGKKKFVDCPQESPLGLSVPVQTAGALVAVPMAKQVVDAHDSPVIDDAPVGKLASVDQARGPVAGSVAVQNGGIEGAVLVADGAGGHALGTRGTVDCSDRGDRIQAGARGDCCEKTAGIPLEVEDPGVAAAPT